MSVSCGDFCRVPWRCRQSRGEDWSGFAAIFIKTNPRVWTQADTLRTLKRIEAKKLDGGRELREDWRREKWIVQISRGRAEL